MRWLVLQHIAIEHPGVIRDFLAADGIGWDAVELDEGQTIPPLDGYDALLVMGGPMDTWQEDDYPWLVDEKRAIRAAIGRGMPYLGVCLGHQLLADALGGAVARSAAPEVGVLDVALTEAGRADPLFAGIAPRFPALQWHSYEVARLPPDGRTLAASPACAHQAIAVGASAYGVQYHVELTEATVAEWGRVPAYEAALEATLGAGGQARLEAEAARLLPDFRRDARRLYDNFLAIARRHPKRR
ncbi:MAG: type 1 glutamine amidotransferase [Alphaproteobacteria bacterium]